MKPLMFRASCAALAQRLMVFALLAQAASAAPPGKRLLSFVGSNTLGEHAIPELSRAYLEVEKQATGVQIIRARNLIHVTGTIPSVGPVFVEIHATGSGDSFRSFLGEFPALGTPCDIGMSSRRIKPEEAEAIKAKRGSDFYWRGKTAGTGCEHPVALDGLAIIVHAENPVSRISFGELRAIYSGKLKSWSGVADWKQQATDAKDGAITPFRRKEPSGTLDFFKEMIHPAEEGAMTDEAQIRAFVSSRGLVSEVVKTPGAIGFVGESYATVEGIKRLQVYDDSPGIEMPPENAVFPDSEAVRSGLYPLSRTVFLYTREDPLNPEVQPFIRFALGSKGQTIIADKGNLVKIEGTGDHLTTAYKPGPQATAETPSGKPKTRLILRLSGSNTVGAECAVNLAINHFASLSSGSVIETVSSPIETPEGETAMIHHVMSDTDKDGTWETIRILPTGSSDAFRDLNSGACDIGMSSRPISAAEQRDLLPVCGNLLDSEGQFALGMDGIAIIVHPENPVNDITLDEIRRVFLGEIQNWKDLGGADKPINLHARPERSGTYKFFSDSVLSGRSVSGAAVRHAENSMVSSKVASDPDSIGWVPLTNAGDAKVLHVSYLPDTVPIPPTEDNIRRGRYPAKLCRYIYFYVPPSMPESPDANARRNWQTARDFAEMSQSWRGQTVVENSGYIGELNTRDKQSLTRRKTGESFPDFMVRLGKTQREVLAGKLVLEPDLIENEVCPLLLFEFNEWSLTPESQNTIDRKLASWLSMHPHIAKAGLVAEGWADSVGTDKACRAISLKRAIAIATYVSSSLDVKTTAVGMGKSNDPPNTSEINKQKNRRVVLKLAK